MTQMITFPQVPFIDPNTGALSLEWFMWLQNPQVASIIIGVAIDVTSGGTGLTSGTSGGILGFTAATTMASSVELTANEIILGGGAGTTPVPLGTRGTSSTVLHGNASGAPTFALVDLATETTGTLTITRGGTNSTTALMGQSIIISDGTSIVQGPKGLTTKVLHGDPAGSPYYDYVILTSDVSGILPVANGGTGHSTMQDNVLEMGAFLTQVPQPALFVAAAEQIIAVEEFAA